MCGEHPSSIALTIGAAGSSPHVRGALTHQLIARHRAGIIPACAGSTVQVMLQQSKGRDHPRMCGEHNIRAKSAARVVGSSPHVRGARTPIRMDVFYPGIIPACAGSTKGDVEIFNAVRDHPRMCGEHLIGGFVRALIQGSSPHVRGAPLKMYNIGYARGIIPACAGSTRHG